MRLRGRSRSCLLIAGLLVLPAAAHATGTEADTFGSEEMLLFQEIPSVFGASKYEQKTSEAPSTVSIVTADEIRKYGYRNLTDILRGQRGFYVTNDHMYDYIGVRGFGRPGDYNTRVLVLVDGHRINENVYDSTAPGWGFPLDIDLIERLEIIRGPSSSLYGTGAFFGIINIITRAGRDYQGVEVAGALGSHQSRQGRVTYGDRYANGVELLLSGSSYDSNGRDWYFAEYDTPAIGDGHSIGQDGEHSPSLFMKAGYHDLTITGAYVDRAKDVPTAAWETAFNRELAADDRQYYLDAHYERTLAGNLAVSGRVSFNEYEYDADYPYFDDDDLLYSARDEAAGTWWTYELQGILPVGERHKVIAGTEYRDNIRQNQYYFADVTVPDPADLRSEESAAVWALYLQDEFRLRRDLLLNVGLRHDDYETFGGSTSPRLAIIYNPTEKTALKAVYGRAFRAPNVYELYYEDGVSSKSNPALDPEEIDTYELIWEQYQSTNIHTVLTGFYYQIDNLIDQVTVDDLQVFDNLDQVSAYGVELELEIRLGIVDSRMSVTYQETEEKNTGARLSNSPRIVAKANLSAPIWQDKVYSSLEIMAMGNRKNDTSAAVFAGHAITNLTLYSTKLLSNLETSASVYNLFDNRYRDPNGDEHYQMGSDDVQYMLNGVEQEGRTYRLKLSYLF